MLGEGANKEIRWRTVLQSQSKDGVELACTWRKLKLEATKASHFLNKELPLVFQPTEEG